MLIFNVSTRKTFTSTRKTHHNFEAVNLDTLVETAAHRDIIAVVDMDRTVAFAVELKLYKVEGIEIAVEMDYNVADMDRTVALVVEPTLVGGKLEDFDLNCYRISYINNNIRSTSTIGIEPDYNLKGRVSHNFRMRIFRVYLRSYSLLHRCHHT